MTTELPEKNKIKLIATDIDGTLLTPQGKISERTRNVIQKILKKQPELHFVLASGRSRPATIKICESLDILNRPKTEALLCNGCIIYDAMGNIIWQNTLPVEFILKFYEILKNRPNNGFYFSCGDDSLLFDKEWAKLLHDEYQEQVVLTSPEEFLKNIETGQIKVNKACFLVKSKEEANEIKSKLNDLKEEYNLENAYSSGIFFEYMPSQTNKGTGLQQLMNRLNITKDEVIVFGDGGNDIELLKTAGWSVAMENAYEGLKPHAKLFTKSNAEDGVADLLEKIFLKEEQMN